MIHCHRYKNLCFPRTISDHNNASFYLYPMHQNLFTQTSPYLTRLVSLHPLPHANAATRRVLYDIDVDVFIIIIHAQHPVSQLQSVWQVVNYFSQNTSIHIPRWVRALINNMCVPNFFPSACATLRVKIKKIKCSWMSKQACSYGTCNNITHGMRLFLIINCVECSASEEFK
jgi:hypothetical protein